MATKARETGKRADEEAQAQAEQPSAAEGGGQTAVADQARPEQPAEGRFEGRRSATLDLPFVTAQFRAPELRAPTRKDLNAAARGARSMLPSGKSALFYGGLAVTAVAGVIEWPVAVAIGVGTALANQGAASPAPSGGPAQPAEVSTTGAGEAEDQKA
jgi:hypothetical protein